MRKFVLVFALSVSLISLPGQAMGTPKAVKYSSCKSLWKKYPNGVAETRTSAREAIDAGFERPTIDKSVYRANYVRLDENYDGVICEHFDQRGLDLLEKYVCRDRPDLCRSRSD